MMMMGLREGLVMAQILESENNLCESEDRI